MSEEILGVVVALRSELMALNIPGVMAATIYLQQDNGSIRVWDLTSTETDPDIHGSIDLVFRLEDTHPDLWVRRIWSSDKNYCVVEQDEYDFSLMFEWLRSLDKNVADYIEHFVKSNKIKHAWHPTVPLRYGKLNVDLLEPPQAEMEFILVKMAAAFDLAYKRFLDLQKAEAQAKSTDKSGVGRVRSRTMACTKRQLEVINVVSGN
jgi:hypothetical protein